jgi:hypothetical protein
MTISTAIVDQRGWFKFTLTGAVSAANAGLGEIANPEGVTLGIVRAFIYARTGSTGAANLDLGIGASGAKASDICSAMSVIEADLGGDLTFLPAAEAAETDSPTALWTTSTFLTATGSADTTGLDADVYIEYIRLA